MKNVYLFLALLGLIVFSAWATKVKPTNEKQSHGSLYESPDDPRGANVYDFYRLRNPQTGLVPQNILQNELAFAATLPKCNESLRSSTWQNRGPYNLGGRTRAVALDVTDSNTILAGQVTGGMWRSDDGGASFTQTTQPEQLHSTTSIVQDIRAGHTNTWYYGTGEEYAIVNAAGYSSQFAGDGIFKSTDGAHTWTQLQSTLSNNYPNPFYSPRNFDFVWQMVTDPVDTADIVYAAVVNGIWRSADGGNTWTAVLGLDTTVSTVSLYADIAITSTGVLYATISGETPSGGIYRSTDGINWTNISPLLPEGFERIEIGIAPSDESQVYFIGQTPGLGATGHSLWHYKYLSGDGSDTGGVWTTRTTNIPHDHCESYFGIDFKAYNSQDSYDMFISVFPTDTNTVFLGGTDLYRSSDGFTSYGYDWIGGYVCDTANLADYVYPGHHPDQHRLIFYPGNPNIAISATDGGIMRTQNALADTVVWQVLNNGYNTGQFYTCTVEPGNTSSPQIIGGLQDNGSFFTGTLDYTQRWPKVFYGDGGYCAITHGRTNYYMSFEEGKVFKMTVTDNGTVTGLTRIDPTGGTDYLFIAPFVLDPINDSIMYLAAGRLIWRNDSLNYIPIVDNQYDAISQGWVAMTNTATGYTIESPNVSTIDISEANPNLLFYGTDQGGLFMVDSCRTSTTTTQVNLTGSNFPPGAYLSSVCVDRLNTNNILVTFSNYGVVSIFYSSNQGQTWIAVSGNLEQNVDGSGNGPSVAWGHIYDDGANVMYYAGTSVGLYSTDSLNGTNTIWTQEGPNTIGNVVVDMVTSRTYDGNIVVATHGNGIYSNQIFTPSAIRNVTKIQAGLNCFPNPFNSNVVINFENGSNGEMIAEIFDISGKLIRRLESKNVNQIIWDGNDYSGHPIARGTYIIKAGQAGKTAFQKVVKI